MSILLTIWNTFRAAIAAVWRYTYSHKVVATIATIVVLWGGYYVYGLITAPSTAPRYVTSIVATGTVVASISETGQVSASSNVDVLSKSSGEVLSLSVTAGQHVLAGSPLAYLDPTSARQNVTSAERALTSTKIALASTLQTLSQSHDTGYTDMSTAFLSLPAIVSGLDSILHGYNVPGHSSQQNMYAYNDLASTNGVNTESARALVESSYQNTYTSYTKAIEDFKSTPRTADPATIAATIKESFAAIAALSDSLKASTDFLDSVNTAVRNSGNTIPVVLTNHISTLTSYTNTVHGYVTTLSNDVANISSAPISDAPPSNDPLALQSSRLAVAEKEDALAQARQALADTTVRAPFSGTVGKLSVQQYQTIGSGAAVATLVSDNQSVNISVNEVDAAKLRVGMKATITFDALPSISIAGTVSSVNSIGTITSGVVSYAAVVTFDTPNSTIKPGMSATADIITGSDSGLIVPSSAVKASNGQSYVQIFDPPLMGSDTSTGALSSELPGQIRVTTGLTDNSNTIIKSGLQSGVQVVTRVVAGTSAAKTTTAAQTTSLFGGAASGGAARALGR